MKNQHLSEKNRDHVTVRLWELEGILKGLASLFQNQQGDGLNADALFGIGQLLVGLSQELSALKDVLSTREIAD